MLDLQPPRHTPTLPIRAIAATAEDVADALAFALRFQGCKRVHNADEVKGFASTPDAAGAHRRIATAPGAGSSGYCHRMTVWGRKHPISS